MAGRRESHLADWGTAPESRGFHPRGMIAAAAAAATAARVIVGVGAVVVVVVVIAE